jgi:hypothetical protein
MHAIAWSFKTEEQGKLTYRLQVEKIKGTRAKNKTLKALRGWRKVGEGYNNKNKEEILIFSRNFGTMTEWIKWAKAFPFKLQELNKNNKPKPIKLGIETKRKKARKKK